MGWNTFSGKVLHVFVRQRVLDIVGKKRLNFGPQHFRSMGVTDMEATSPAGSVLHLPQPPQTACRPLLSFIFASYDMPGFIV